MRPLLLLLAAAVFLAAAEPCVKTPEWSLSDCPFERPYCYKLGKIMPGHGGLCPPEPPWIDTRTCGRQYLNIDRVREHPCEDPDAPSCVWMQAFFDGELWVIPNIWDEEELQSRKDQLTSGVMVRSEFLPMDEAGFCDPLSWVS